MVTYPTTLDLDRTYQIEDYNMANMQSGSCININIVPPNICSWITSNGGIHPMTFGNVITLRSAYLHVVDLGFTVTFSHVIGARSYYLNQITSGNSNTGCAFT